MKTTFSGIRMRGAPSPDSRIKGGADGETKMADKYAARHLFPDDAVTWKKVYVPSSPHYLVQLRFSFGSGNYFLHFLSYIGRKGERKKRRKTFSQPAGFELARRIPIGFQVQRLNHSATTACLFRYI